MGGDNTSYQMLWDCEYCGSAKLLGLDHKHCPTCGAAQDPESRYFPDAGEEIAVADHKFVGADKLCPACQGPNSALSQFCANCGSPLEGSDDVKRREDRVGTETGGHRGDSARAARDEHKTKSQRVGDSGSEQGSKPKGLGGGPLRLVVGLLIAIVLVVLAFQVLKKEVALEATGHRWERSIDIEEFRTVADSTWIDEVPAGARQGPCTIKKNENKTKKIPDGQNCVTTDVDQGDGTFKKKETCTDKFREVAQDDHWCSYEIDRWERIDTKTARGSGTAGLLWPEVALARTGSGDCLGCQREGDRDETYTVELLETTNGDKYTSSCSQERWQGIATGQRFSATALRGLSSISCDSLQAPK